MRLELSALRGYLPTGFMAGLGFRPDEAIALGGIRYQSGIVFAGQIQFFEPGRPMATAA